MNYPTYKMYADETPGSDLEEGEVPYHEWSGHKPSSRKSDANQDMILSDKEEAYGELYRFDSEKAEKEWDVSDSEQNEPQKTISEEDAILNGIQEEIKSVRKIMNEEQDEEKKIILQDRINILKKGFKEKRYNFKKERKRKIQEEEERKQNELEYARRREYLEKLWQRQDSYERSQKEIATAREDMDESFEKEIASRKKANRDKIEESYRRIRKLLDQEKEATQKSEEKRKHSISTSQEKEATQKPEEKKGRSTSTSQEKEATQKSEEKKPKANIFSAYSGIYKTPKYTPSPFSLQSKASPPESVIEKTEVPGQATGLFKALVREQSRADIFKQDLKLLQEKRAQMEKDQYQPKSHRKYPVSPMDFERVKQQIRDTLTKIKEIEEEERKKRKREYLEK